MSRVSIRPTGVERTFSDDEIIVSKTDLTGKITYVNDVFVRVSGYPRAELLGAAHSIIRHPDMPRCVFQVLWDTIQGGQEVFAYVVNLARNGEHYWVLAHVTPTFDAAGRIVGYHSNRRTVDRRALPTIEALYARLRADEQGHPNKREAVAASMARLNQYLQDRGQTYDAFVWSF
jgi:PAS domain S-box-containing protein